MEYRERETSPQAPACCQNCGTWLCGDHAPTPTIESQEYLTTGWLYCSTECLAQHLSEIALVVT